MSITRPSAAARTASPSFAAMRKLSFVLNLSIVGSKTNASMLKGITTSPCKGHVRRFSGENGAKVSTAGSGEGSGVGGAGSGSVGAAGVGGAVGSGLGSGVGVGLGLGSIGGGDVSGVWRGLNHASSVGCCA